MVSYWLSLIYHFIWYCSLNANERHHGVVMAIALEAVAKLLALIAVGIFVVWGISGGISNVINEIDSFDNWTLGC